MPALLIRSVLVFLLFDLTVISPDLILGFREDPPETRRSETVAPGVEHVEIRRGNLAAALEADRWVIHALVLDPRHVRLSLGRAFDGGVGVETTSSIAGRHDALAAVNGGYFRTEGLYRGEPAGIVVRGAKVLSEPYRKRPGLAVSGADGSTKLGFINVVVRADAVAADGTSRAINGVNRPRLDDDLILFTPDFHRTTLTGPNGIEAVVAAGLIVAIHDGAGSRAIPADGFVLSAHGTARRWVREHLRPGTSVEVRTVTKVEPELRFDPEFILGGGPVLLRGGAPVAAADTGEYAAGFRLERHPRTAVGARADGRLILVTVDGRQPALSVGMTIDELTALMKELGCREAINLDGGGSTTMVIRGKVVNHPSDAAGERPVGDALLVFLR
ncbi:MAG: phosphodiester glycosidase family protein [Candidatus Aminicenantes bacterium]|nr:phosphodiester glycosidase family protein [Candidatus Aminicenantes bacterium]